jgi:hypothetical protein
MTLLFPMAWSFYAAMGYAILPVASIFVVLGAASLTVVLATAPRALRLFYVVTLPLLALAATLLSPLLDPFSPGSPAHGNLIVVQREGETVAIAGERVAEHVPLPWGDPDSSLFPWVEPPLRFRSARVSPVEAPPLDIVRHDRLFPDGTRHVELTVRPHSEARMVEIHLGGSGIRSLRIEDRPMPDSEEQWRVARVYGPRPWNIRFRVEAGTGEPEVIAQQTLPLSPEHQELVAARPSWLLPVGPGDRLTVQTRVLEQAQAVDIEE